MLTEKDIIRKDTKQRSNGKPYGVNVYECKYCHKELFMTAANALKHSGYCKVCKKLQQTEAIIEKKKTCSRCGIEQDILKFKTEESKYCKNVCNRCSNLKKYGINSREYFELLEKQNYSCAICGKTEKVKHSNKDNILSLAVDHCHITGEVRGLLCNACNTSLGKFRDDVEILKSAIKYLEEFQHSV